MPRKIIGQCNTSDFKHLEHLLILLNRGEAIDVAHLSKRQNAAILVVRHFQLCGVSFGVLLKVREVLVWEMPDKKLAFEYKLLDPGDVDTRQILWTMTPTKVDLHDRNH